MRDSLKDKRLLVLGGTRISCEIIKKAKAPGCFVGVADYNEVKARPAGAGGNKQTKNSKPGRLKDPVNREMIYR